MSGPWPAGRTPPGIDFLAFLLLMVYVGAISILFLFVVMMMDINLLTLRQSPFNKQGFLIFLVFFNILFWFNFFYGAPVVESLPFQYFVWPEIMDSKGTLSVVSSHLYSSYYGSFLIAGYILLVAMIGAIVVTLKQKPYVKRQDVLFQNHRDFEKTVRKVSTSSN